MFILCVVCIANKFLLYIKYKKEKNYLFIEISNFLLIFLFFLKGYMHKIMSLFQRFINNLINKILI